MSINSILTHYEQYLGYVATKVKEKVEAQLRLGITDEETYKLTSKKQHRKEQGIYYTPKFVTDYIVKETVGRFISEHSYNEIRTMKILDPACGSGSFLIRAYDELLNYHAKQRNRSLNELDQKDRLPVLLANIYGVDLDMQAVEITRLNLLLRTLTEKGKLPYLSSNIRQGNSLISGADEELKKYFGDNWRDKKPFNWEQEFKDIMANGGFDIVIGNPPYGIVFDRDAKNYLEEEYPTFRRNNDLFVAFIHRGIQLLRNEGFFAFILPNTFLGGPYFENIRKYVLDHAKVLKVTDFGISRVFLEPNVFNAILVLRKEQNARKRKISTVELTNGLAAMSPSENHALETRLQSKLQDLGWRAIDPVVRKSLEKHPKLGDIAFVKDVGFNYWTIGRGKTRGGSIADKILYDGSKENEQDLPFLKGRDTERYHCAFSSRWLRHNYQDFLDPKVDVFGYGSEFLLHGPKIIYRQTADRIIATIDSQNFLVDKTLHSIRVREACLSDFSLKYILGILNSRLATHIYRDFAKERGRLFAQVKTFVIKKLPIRRIDFDNPAEKKTHDDLVALVDKMLELNKRLAPIRDTYGYEREELLREIKRTDAEIDQKVYEFYGLSEEEKQVIEGSLASKS
ncbi:MAG: N-6 DNA methylase [Chloroflexota bacterium]